MLVPRQVTNALKKPTFKLRNFVHKYWVKNPKLKVRIIWISWIEKSFRKTPTKSKIPKKEIWKNLGSIERKYNFIILNQVFL